MNIYSLKNPPIGFYVYAYLRKKDLSPYYIGKGKNKRAWKKHNNITKPSEDRFIVLLETNLTEIGALAIERRMIKWYGRKDNNTGILHNKTNGGPGCHKMTCKDETKVVLSVINKGKRLSKLHKMRISESNKGKKHSVETRNKLREINTGRKHTEETKIKMRNRSLSEETKNKISQGNKNKKTQKVEVKGICFASINDAANFFKVSGGMISYWRRKGTAINID